MEPPPLLAPPADRVRARVLRAARRNGRGVVLVAGAGMLGALLATDLFAAGAGLLATGAGLLELHGRRRLHRGDPRGLRLLVRAELLLLAVIAVYAGGRILHAENTVPALSEWRRHLSTLGLDLDLLLAASGRSAAELGPLVHRLYLITYGVLLLASLVYQGGMAWWYARQAGPLAAAPASPPLRAELD